MKMRFFPLSKALDTLLQVYAPPKQVRILFWDADCHPELPCPGASAAKSATVESVRTEDATAVSKNASVESCPTGFVDAAILGSPKAGEWDRRSANACNSRTLGQAESESQPDRKRQKLDEKKLAKRRWVGSVVDALSDVFTAIWTNYVEPTDEFQTLAQLRPMTGRPGTDPNLVSRVFSSEKLIASCESFRVHFQLMQAFGSESALLDWRTNSAVNAYISFLKSDTMIRECCLGLFSRLGTPQLETTDQFVDTLKQVWFEPVSLGTGKPDRCGYHHVCIGDFSSKAGVLTGMHNWFKFLIEEERHRTRILNWWSYQKDLHLVSMKFSMKHMIFDAWYTKNVSSFLVGVPTDFELLLFTVITMVNPNQDTRVQIKDYEPLIVVPRSLKKTGSVVTAYFRESPRQRSD